MNSPAFEVKEMITQVRNIDTELAYKDIKERIESMLSTDIGDFQKRNLKRVLRVLTCGAYQKGWTGWAAVENVK